MTDHNMDIIIYRYLAGEATEEDVRILKEWTSASEDNLHTILSLQNIWEVSDPVFDPADINSGAAHTKVTEKIRRTRRSSFFRITQRAAAILFLPFLLLSIYLFSGKPGTEEIAFNEVSTHFNTSSQLTLPDGSVVWLNAGTSIRYPTVFNKSERVVTINGEAYFKVESDRKHPFVVQAGDITVRATGTQFNVNSYGADSIASVILVSGKVMVEIPNDRDPIQLSPGEMASYNRNADEYVVAAADTDRLCSWKDGTLAFHNDPLELVFKRLGQIHNVEFIINDSEISGYLYRATFGNESLEEIIDLIRMSVPIRYKEVDGPSDEGDQAAKRRCIEIYRNH